MALPAVNIVVAQAVDIPQARLNSSDEVKKIVQQSGAQGCVSVSHNPSVQVYFALRRKIESSDDDWLLEFLRLDGLESLLDSLSHMSGKAFTNFSDAILMLDCVSCIRTVLNRQIGLDFVLQQASEHHLIRKLITALDSSNTLPKKQVFEMLAVVCVHGSRGYHLVLDALDHFKKETNQSHPFSVVVNELKDADNVPYKTAILTLINCIIMCTTDLVERCRFRTEFEGLQLLDVLNFLRKEDSDEDLSIQLEKFHVHKHRDDEELEKRTRVNMTDPHQLLKELMKKIFASPMEASLVQILQDLLFLSSTNKDTEEESETIWDILKKVVHQVVTEKSKRSFVVDLQQGEIIQPAFGQQNTCTCKCNSSSHSGSDAGDKTLKQQASNVVSKARKLFEVNSQPAEPAAIVIKNKGRVMRYQPPARPPVRKMKTLRWVPLFDEDIEDSDAYTIWDREEARITLRPETSDIEALFSEDKVFTKDITEVQLLEPSTRLQLNLFLERMDIDVDDLVRSLEREDPVPISSTSLKCLSQVLPCPNEISAVRKYTGSRLDLGMAEQFVLYLSDVSHYRVLLEGHLTRAEFTSSLSKLKSSLKAQNDACQEILDSSSLAKFFRLVLDVGNFLNFDKFNGKAAGFTVATLSRLNRVRSNVPNKTLLHFLVKLAEDRDDSMLQFLSDFSHLDKASKLSLEEIKTEVNDMNARLRRLIQQLSKTSNHVRDVFEFFLEDVRQDFATFQTDINNLRVLSHRVAVYFCETEQDFSLQECFRELRAFCKAVKKCQEENMLFGRQQRLAVGRMSQLKTHVKNRRISLEFGKEAVASSSFVEDKGQVLEYLLTEIHRGNFHPLAASDLTTPDRENQTFDFDLDSLSPIQQVFSPYRLGQPLPPIASMETLNDFTLVTNKNQDVSTYDLLEEYQQPVDAATQQDNPYSTRPNMGVAAAIRPGTLFPPTQVTNNVAAPKPAKTHHRSRSDLLEVSSVAEKWVMYEQVKLRETSDATLTDEQVRENHRLSAVYSMDLEDKGTLKPHNEVYLPSGPVVVLPGQEPFKRTKNRSSLRNFLNKISGVGKNRNGCGKEKQNDAAAKGKKKEENKKAPVTEYMKSDKENVFGVMKRFGSQRYKKEPVLKMRNK